MRYRIEGEPLPVAIIDLEENESIITEKGAMSWMSPNMEMETYARGGVGKAFGRSFSGDSMFQNVYTPRGGVGHIALTSSFPGKILAMQISADNELIVQKHAFLGSEEGVNTEAFFRKKLASGVFSGEGFIMQRLYGQGVAFVELDGYLVEYDLAEGQQILLSSGHLAMMSRSCNMDVQTVKGMKNKLLGGEGFFNTVVTGPGHVWVQTMPMPAVAEALQPFIVTSS